LRRRRIHPVYDLAGYWLHDIFFTLVAKEKQTLKAPFH
jgi:hypothetical protein